MAYLVLGVFVGLLSGLLGIGGGVLVTPALVFVFHQQGLFSDHVAQVAAGSSLAVIIFTAFASMVAYQQKGSIDWSLVKRILPGIILGALIGALTATLVPSAWLARFLGFFVFLIALQMLFLGNIKNAKALPNDWILAFLGLIIGAVGSLVGIGGGLLLLPFLTYYQLSIHRAAGTVITCSFFVALMGVCSLTVMPYFLPEVHRAYVFWPAVLWIVPTSIVFAWIGTFIAHKLPVRIMKHIFAGFLAIVGVYLIFWY